MSIKIILTGTSSHMSPSNPLLTPSTLSSGATGTAGSEAFRQCLLNPSVTQLTVLTRRPLPSHVYIPTIPPNPKVNIIIHKDFNTYDDELLKELEGSDGCLWDLGIRLADFPPLADSSMERSSCCESLLDKRS